MGEYFALGSAHATSEVALTVAVTSRVQPAGLLRGPTTSAPLVIALLDCVRQEKYELNDMLQLRVHVVLVVHGYIMLEDGWVCSIAHTSNTFFSFLQTAVNDEMSIDRAANAREMMEGARLMNTTSMWSLI